MKYSYKGRISGGEPVSGIMTASDPKQLRDKLLKQVVILESYEELLGRFTLWALGLVSKKEVTRTTRQLATLLGSGLTVAEGIQSLAEDEKDRRLRAVYRTIHKRLEEGARFSTALSAFQQLFDRTYISLAEAGEMSGNLAEIMTGLAEHRERMEELKRKFYAAMVYPSLVVTVSIAVLLAVFKYVIPVFAEMYANFGAEIPPLTQDVIGFSEFIKENSLVIVVSVISVLTSSALLLRIWSVRVTVHRLALKSPILGPIWRKVALARFARTLGMLHLGGTDLLSSIDTSCRVVGNAYLELKIEPAKGELERGETLRNSLESTGVFPSPLLRMVASGEKTGRLGEMLTSGAKYYESEIESSLTAITSVIEPIIILALGSIVGFIIVVMYLPLFDLITQIGP